MRVAFAIFRFELRMLRRDVLLSGILLGVVIAVVLATGGQGAGEALSPLLRGIVLGMLVLLGLTRVALMQDAWTALRITQPIPPRALALSGALLWAAFSFMPACAYVLWVGPADEAPVLHALCVWLWLMLAGTAVGLLLGDQTRKLWAGIAFALCGFALLTLATSLGDVVTGDVTSDVALRLAFVVALTLIPGRLAGDEWLPSQSPKEVKPRSRIIGGLKRRLAHARSPRQVLAWMGVRRFGVGPDGAYALFMFVYGGLMVASLISDLDGGGRPSFRGGSGDLIGVLVVVFGAGLYVSLALRQTSASWAFLRAFPVRRAAVWGRTLIWMPVFTVLWLGIFLCWQHVSQPDGIVDNFEGHEGPFSTHGGWGKLFPGLATPAWVREDGALDGRPRGMPLPRWGRWPLKPIWGYDDEATEAFEGVDEEAFFITAVRYYLDVVHGVPVSDEELEAALGDPCILEGTSALVPEQYFFEDVASRGYGMYFGFAYRQGDGVVSVHPFKARPAHAAPRTLPRRALYAYAPALNRLQAAIGARLTRAALLRTILDACIVVLAVLVFVRFALLDGPLRYVLPLLAVAPVLLCFGGRGTALWRAIRDAHLAHPWAAPALTAVLACGLILGIRRQLGRSTPGSAEFV